MNFEKYQKETIRTFAFRKTSLTTTMTDMLHCAIGIGTEVGELLEAFDKVDLVNVGEEIADQMWYISNLANFIKLDLEKDCALVNLFTFENRNFYIDKSVKLSSELLDMFKKSIYYNKELDLFKIKTTLIDMIINLNNLCGCVGIELNEQLDKNIAKLRIRFPDKFTEDLAENRDLESERKALEE